MADEPLFRFLSVRPPDPQRKLERKPAKTSLYDDNDRPSDFRAAVQRAEGSESARREIPRLVEGFHQSGGFVDDLGKLNLAVGAAVDWSLAHAELAVDDPAAGAGLASALGDKPLKKLAGSTAFAQDRTRIADSIFAETLEPSAGGRLSYDNLVVAFKLLTLVAELAAKASFPEGTTIGEAIGGRTVIVPPSPVPVEEKAVPAPPVREDPRLQGLAAARARLEQLEAAHRELSDVTARPGSLETVANAGKETIAVRMQALEQRLSTVKALDRTGSGKGDEGGAPPGPPAAAGSVKLSPEAAAGLSAHTTRVAAELKLSLDQIDPVFAVGQIERQMTSVSAELASLQAPQAYLTFAGAEIDKASLIESFGIGAWLGRPELLISEACDFAAGVGDLLIVKQRLKAYELGDFAYVENVLAGETRDREHRRLDTSEETTTDETETETEKDKDLQSTQRNETQTEADKTVKQQFGLEAGLQVSGSYGPTVQFAAHLNANYSTASEETQRKSVSFSQEVTQKASEKVSERVRHAVTRRVLEEVQEINRHTFTNTSNSKHIRGIYRWLNKVYDAQILNYGQRMMYEFVVPEPAAWFLYAMVENPPPDTEIVKPDPPTFGGVPLQPSHLTRTNYQSYVAKYQVRGVPSPPPEFQTASYFDKQDKVQDGTEFGRAGKIDIPPGYEAFGATVMADYAFTSNDSHAYRIMIGGQSFDFSDVWGCEYQDLGPGYRELSIAYSLFHAWEFALGVDVACRLSVDGFAKWQQQVFDGITEGYLKLKADYEEKKAARELQQGPVLGRNPLENQRLMKDELKKLALMMLTGSDEIARDSFYASSEPLMRLDSACENGSWIRFFENAFEWTNLVYVFYPYFWGRHARWGSAIHLTDPDPEFAAFLRAGAARVQVPVRPGFEKAVAHFCQFGEIWNGNDPPLRDDELYVPIVDEIAANLGKFDDEGVPYPTGSKPWEVRVPTELVVVQDLEEIPNILDALTGNAVELIN